MLLGNKVFLNSLYFTASFMLLSTAVPSSALAGFDWIPPSKVEDTAAQEMPSVPPANVEEAQPQMPPGSASVSTPKADEHVLQAPKPDDANQAGAPPAVEPFYVKRESVVPAQEPAPQPVMKTSVKEPPLPQPPESQITPSKVSNLPETEAVEEKQVQAPAANVVSEGTVTAVQEQPAAGNTPTILPQPVETQVAQQQEIPPEESGLKLDLFPVKSKQAMTPAPSQPVILSVNGDAADTKIAAPSALDKSPEEDGLLPTPAAVQEQKTETVLPQHGEPQTYPVIEGFGSDMALAIALTQIVPPDYSYSFGRGVNPGAVVSWEGGKPWNAVLEDVLKPLGIHFEIIDKTVMLKNAV